MIMLMRNKHRLSDFDVQFIKKLTHYSPVLLSIPTENIRKPEGFLTFSGGIEKQQWAVMG